MSTAVIEATEFGEAVRRRRESRGWNRPQMVQRLRAADPSGDWKVQKLTHLERGNVRHPSLRTIRLLSVVLGCEPNDLVWPDDAESFSQSAWTGDTPPDLLERAA